VHEVLPGKAPLMSQIIDANLIYNREGSANKK